ncbi:MAG: 6-bladed beta-propeller [Spirochaetaceae bacterium]|jgi:DNA-binding beta-propeller fold protein YncE|nr:6-bladed beta-propeller [Spirochaetaceae bacterium]
MRFVHEPIDFEVYIGGCGDAAVDSRGRIFAISIPYPVTIFGQDGKLIKRWPEGIIGCAHGIYIDEADYVYIVDSDWHLLTKFSPEGEILMRIGSRGVRSDTGAEKGNYKTIRWGAPPFYAPSKVTVSPWGEIFVTDGYGNSRVHRFSAEGKLLASWGEPGGGPGQFRLPHGIGVDKDNRVYVADRENDRVQIFDVEGQVLDIWNNINRPDGICVRDDLVYVAELGHIAYNDNVMYELYENMPWSQVVVFDTGGCEITRFGGEDPWREGNLYSAHGANLDREGNLYIADSGLPDSNFVPDGRRRHALQKFKRIG